MTAQNSDSQADTKSQPNTESTNSLDETGPYQFVFTSTPTEPCSSPQWVLDSGATCCATFYEDDCIDARDCNVKVTGSFPVLRMGTAVINTVDEQGRSVQLKMRNTLISPKFPYKLLALQLFTARGMEINMNGQRMRIASPVNDHVLFGVRDSKTQLFFLPLPGPADSAPATSHTLLARSYGGKTDADLLWKLHLRHGHLNFAALGRQYGLTVPKEIPACLVYYGQVACSPSLIQWL
jgi:hypothetical protein